jgi:hypothetical protein
MGDTKRLLPEKSGICVEKTGTSQVLEFDIQRLDATIDDETRTRTHHDYALTTEL